MTANLFDSNPSEPGWHTAWCDGGSRGNPGPSAYGAVILDPAGQTVARLSHFLGIQTNNYAEYHGLLAVLDWALANHVPRLRVISDSELMVKQLKGQYKVASPILRPLWEQAKLLSKRLEKFDIRHTLRGGNKDADQLANEAMDKAMGKRPAPLPASAPLAPKPQRQILEGFVKNGVVHLIEGSLPEGIIVKIIQE
jgi:probable phosphoglycerate mutase